MAKDLPNEIAVLAAAPRGTLLHAPDCYMDKIAGPAEVEGEISLEADVAYNLEAAASALSASSSVGSAAERLREAARLALKRIMGEDDVEELTSIQRRWGK